MFFLEKMKYTYIPYPFEDQMKIPFLLHRVWFKKGHHQICHCDLKFGDCLARFGWSIDRLRQLWKTSDVDFDFVINKALDQDPSFVNFDQITSLSFEDFEVLLLKI